MQSVASEAVCKTTDTTPFDLFVFELMSEGLRNTVRTLQSILNHLSKKLNFVGSYQDEILVPSKDHEENHCYLEELLWLLQAIKRKVN